MSAIPQDIMAKAMVVADSEVNFGSYEVNTLAIARAIMAERERCAQQFLTVASLYAEDNQGIGIDIISDVCRAIRHGSGRAAI